MSAEEEDPDYDQFIQSRLEEMMPADTEGAPKVKPTFQPLTMQSKLTAYFPRIYTFLLLPGKRRQEDRMKEGLLTDRKPLI
jgi:hypothetical protein